jgi:hypothetical protein
VPGCQRQDRRGPGSGSQHVAPNIGHCAPASARSRLAIAWAWAAMAAASKCCVHGGGQARRSAGRLDSSWIARETTRPVHQLHGYSRRYQVPPCAARTIAALLALRDHVIGPFSPVSAARMGRNPTSGSPSTAVTRTCVSACRTSSTTSASPLPPHRQHFVDHEMSSGLDRLAIAMDNRLTFNKERPTRV